jgi:hypothetical protein
MSKHQKSVLYIRISYLCSRVNSKYWIRGGGRRSESILTLFGLWCTSMFLDGPFKASWSYFTNVTLLSTNPGSNFRKWDLGFMWKCVARAFHQYIRYYNTIIFDRDNMAIWMFRIVTSEISLNQRNLLLNTKRIPMNTYEFSEIILVHKCSTLWVLNSDGWSPLQKKNK